MSAIATSGRVVDVPRAASADRVPFEDFFRECWPDLVAFLRTLVRDGSAEELAQEALTRVYVRYPLLAEPRPYLFKVAANLVRRSWRESPRTTSLDEVADTAVAGDDRSSTVDVVRRLPPRLRDVVLLHYYADLPLAEVARLVHVPLGTAKRRLHEARARLAVDLREDL